MSIGSFGGIYGLSGSGMDIDMIVKKLMVGEQTKQDALYQKKTVAEWQKAAYNAVYDEISKFRDTVFNYKLQATLSPNKVTSSNTSVVTATANAEAADVTHSLVVAQLAGGVNLTSLEKITTGAGKDTIANQFYPDSAPVGPYTFTIANGEASAEIPIDPTTESINDLVSKINKANINLKANYDSTLDRFFLSTTNTGSEAGIKITADDADSDNWVKDFFVEKLMLPEEVCTTGKKGQDAAFQLDGVGLTMPSNTFTISGVTYNLTGVSPNITGDTVEEKLASGTPTTISVTNDIDTAVASIQALVDSYNALMESLNSKLNEPRYKDFPPLTDAQKAEMKESEITAWEAKAKSGMLHNDSTLRNLVYALRNAFSSTVSGTSSIYNSASAIGITTGSNYLEGGKLYFDADKLRAALSVNPNILAELFGAAETTNEDGTINKKTQGIAGRLYDALNTTMTQLYSIAGTTGSAAYDTSSNYAKIIRDYDKQISRAADRYESMREAYYKQFNAMEVALQQLNSQSGWLLSMFNNNGSSS